MSNEHAIDLCERSQEDFKNLLLNLNKKSSYWCVFDKNCHILEMSDVLPECFFLPKKTNNVFYLNQMLSFYKMKLNQYLNHMKLIFIRFLLMMMNIVQCSLL